MIRQPMRERGETLTAQESEASESMQTVLVTRYCRGVFRAVPGAKGGAGAGVLSWTGAAGVALGPREAAGVALSPRGASGAWAGVPGTAGAGVALRPRWGKTRFADGAGVGVFGWACISAGGWGAGITVRDACCCWGSMPQGDMS